MSKKIITFLLVIILLMLSYTTSIATDLNTKLMVVQKEGELKYLENNQGYISKAIIDTDEEKGEVTIEIKLLNSEKKLETENETYENTEIIIIVPENIVSSDENGKLSEYSQYIETLATRVFEKNSKTKIGIVGMKGPISDSYIDENGKMVYGEKNEGSKAGTADDAELVVNMTNDISVIKNGLQNMNNQKLRYYNNFEAAIKLSKSSFSNKVNKILISLYDTVPSTSIGQCSQVSYGGWSGYDTIEEAVNAKNEKMVKTTKQEILSLKNSNIDFILLRPDDTDFDQKWYDVSSGELILDFDGSSYVKELYGTMQSPTYGKLYSLNEDSLQEIVTEKIYEDIMETVGKPITYAKIVDYFPTKIIKNFDFEYVEGPNIGTVSEGIEEQTNSISWDIGTLDGNETATLKYKLKIKDMKNEGLLNKTIATNEKVVVTYKDIESKDYTVELTNNPKIKLSEVKEELTAMVSYNPTKTTTGSVTATIKTNKPVNSVEGWTLSEDKMNLTKEYSSNITETIHLVSLDKMEADVEIKIANIIKDSTVNNNSNNNEQTNNNTINNDSTKATGTLPYTGPEIVIAIAVIAIVGLGIYLYRKNKDLRGM